MIRLFTSSYDELRENRVAEYLECIRRNVACEALAEICVMTEGRSAHLPANERIQIRPIGRRPKYEDFFSWINEVASADDVSIVANSDIWFDGSIAVASRAIGERDCFALARWDDDRLFDRNDSQDCWVFKGCVTGVDGSFPVGVPRCDNRILYELGAAGFRVLNPAFSIVTHHVHEGLRTEYSLQTEGEFVDGPYRYLWPHNLWSLPRTLLHNTRSPAEPLLWRLDRRRMAATLPGRAVARARRHVLHERGGPTAAR